MSKKIVLDKQLLYKLYVEENNSAGDVSIILNCTRKAVIKNLWRYDIPRHHNLCKERRYIDSDLLIKLYCQEGKPTTELSKQFNMSCGALIVRLKKAGVSIRNCGSKGNEVKIKKEDLYRLYVVELKSSTDIAKMYGLSYGTICKYLNLYGFSEYIKGYRPNFKLRGDRSSSKRPEVKAKFSMAQLNRHMEGPNNPNYGNGEKFRGDKNPNWLGGCSKGEYPYEFNCQLKDLIRKRDDYKCQNCGMTEEEHLA